MPRILVPLVLAIIGAILAFKVGPMEREAVEEQMNNFPGVQEQAHALRPLIAMALCMLPAVAGLLYFFGSTLARYVTRQFLAIFFICLAGLFVVWLIADLGDNLDDLKLADHPGKLALRLYTVRLPEILVMLLPYSLLLSIVAMIQTGRGLARLTMPFLVTGILAAVFCAGLNYQWAPAAVGAENAILREAKGIGGVAEPNIRYRNFSARRLWMVGSFPRDYQKGVPLQDVTVIQEHPDGRLDTIISAKTAAWSPTSGVWILTEPRKRVFGNQRVPRFVRDLPDPMKVHGWEEVPSQIIRPGLPAEQLGIPDLNDWLEANPDHSWASRGGHLTQWHYRWAQPVNCLIVVLLATPLGVVFSRRGTSGGVAMAVFLCAGMLFVSNVCLNLGASGHLKPAWAAWLPNLAFGTIAIYLFQRRLAGRPIYQTLMKFLPAGS
jgi:lipopolysaccharide export system permease protein